MMACVCNRDRLQRKSVKGRLIHLLLQRDLQPASKSDYRMCMSSGMISRLPEL